MVSASPAASTVPPSGCDPAKVGQISNEIVALTKFSSSGPPLPYGGVMHDWTVGGGSPPSPLAYCPDVFRGAVASRAERTSLKPTLFARHLRAEDLRDSLDEGLEMSVLSARCKELNWSLYRWRNVSGRSRALWTPSSRGVFPEVMLSTGRRAP